MFSSEQDISTDSLLPGIRDHCGRANRRFVLESEAEMITRQECFLDTAGNYPYELSLGKITTRKTCADSSETALNGGRQSPGTTLF